MIYVRETFLWRLKASAKDIGRVYVHVTPQAGSFVPEAGIKGRDK